MELENNDQAAPVETTNKTEQITFDVQQPCLIETSNLRTTVESTAVSEVSFITKEQSEIIQSQNNNQLEILNQPQREPMTNPYPDENPNTTEIIDEVPPQQEIEHTKPEEFVDASDSIIDEENNKPAIDAPNQESIIQANNSPLAETSQTIHSEVKASQPTIEDQTEEQNNENSSKEQLHEESSEEQGHDELHEEHENEVAQEEKNIEITNESTGEVTTEENADGKCKENLLETTNETIAPESLHQEEIACPAGAGAEETINDNQHDKSENEPSENLVNMSEQPATATTPKALKKKSKTSTPTKHSLNDIHASQKRRKKDPSAPKAPLNGYLVYFNDERADMRQKNPNMSFGELTKIIALKWKDLPTEEKQRFITEADMDKERYVKEMAEYKKSDSYRQYVKEVSQAKQARNEEAIVNSMHNDPMNLTNNSPNNFSIVNETNVAGFDIPIFTEEFIEHCKTRENEMRVIRKEITELEQQNSVLHKHIEIMKQSSAKLDTDLEHYQNTNNQLKNKMDTFRQTIINCNIQLPNTMELPTPNNIDDYIMKMHSIVSGCNNGNQTDMAFVAHVKSVLSKINFSTLFE